MSGDWRGQQISPGLANEAPAPDKASSAARRGRAGTAATAAILRDRFGPEPFTTAEALATVSRGRWRAAVAAGRVDRVRRGHWIVSKVPAVPPHGLLLADSDEPLRWHGGQQTVTVRRVALEVARFAADGVPATAALETAAHLHGIPTVGHDHAGANRVTLFVPRHADVRRGARSDLLVRATNLPRRQRDTRLGVPTTSLLRTAVDLARGQPLPSALVPLDAALRQWILRLSDSQRGSANSALEAASVPRARATDELAAIIATMARLPGIRAVRRAAEDVDPKAETPLESLSRGRFLAAGLPRPVAQLAVHGDDGRTYRSDLGWPQYRVLGEADGALKYVDRADLLREKEREDSLRRAGWIVVRWTWDEILRRPEVVVRRILAALNSYLTAQPLRSHRKG